MAPSARSGGAKASSPMWCNRTWRAPIRNSKRRRRTSRIGFDQRTDEVRLKGLESRSYQVSFGQTNFVEMVRRSGVPATRTLIRMWLCAIYFDPHPYRWARLEPPASPM